MTKMRIKWSDDVEYVGEQVQTRGNDEDFPTFLLSDGRTVSVASFRVIGPIASEDECSPHGMERPTMEGGSYASG